MPPWLLPYNKRQKSNAQVCLFEKTYQHLGDFFLEVTFFPTGPHRAKKSNGRPLCVILVINHPTRHLETPPSTLHTPPFTPQQTPSIRNCHS